MYRSAQSYWTSLNATVDTDCRSSNPPSAKTITQLILLKDHKYLMLNGNRPSIYHGMIIACISHTPKHQFYKKVKSAFDYANSRRKKAGLPLNKWPIPIPPPLPPLNRRLIWSLNSQEVKAAHAMFRRFVRQGLVPFQVDTNGDATKRISVFSPKSCEILFKCGAVT